MGRKTVYFFHLGLSRLFNSLVRFLTLLVLIRYIDLEFNGFWSVYLVIIAFYTTSHLGVLNGFLIRIPKLTQPYRYNTFRALQNQSMISLLASLVIGAIGLAFYLSRQSTIHLSVLEISSLLLVAGLSYLTFFIEISFTAQNHYRDYSLWLGWTSLVQIIMVWLGAAFGGRQGFCLGYSSALIISLWGAHSRLRFQFRFSLIKWIYLLKTGFPMTLSGWISSLILTLDRLILGIFFTPLACGHYYLCVLSGSLFLMLPRILQRINLTDWASTSPHSRPIRTELRQQISIYCLISALFGLGFYLIAPPLVHHFVPHYSPGLTALFYLLPGLLIYGIREIAFSYLMLQKKRRLAIWFDSSTLISSLFIYWIAYRWLSGTIESIAIATSLSYSLNTILYLGYLMRTDSGNVRSDGSRV